MKKLLFFSAAVLCICASASAESYKETFDSNSLNWTECTFDNRENIKSFIDRGVLTVHSEKNTNIWTGVTEYSFSESMCYAPIDVQKPFKIITHFRYDDGDYACGIRFNMRDNGTYYAIILKQWASKIVFQRVVDGEVVGGISQGYLFPKLKKGENYELIIENKGGELRVTMQDVPVFAIRYMPCEYTGFGYFTRGDINLYVDDVEFKQ